MNALANVSCMEMLKLKKNFGRKVIPVPKYHAMKAYLDIGWSED
jgi:hypothetical protein